MKDYPKLGKVIRSDKGMPVSWGIDTGEPTVDPECTPRKLAEVGAFVPTWPANGAGRVAGVTTRIFTPLEPENEWAHATQAHAAGLGITTSKDQRMQSFADKLSSTPPLVLTDVWAVVLVRCEVTHEEIVGSEDAAAQDPTTRLPGELSRTVTFHDNLSQLITLTKRQIVEVPMIWPYGVANAAGEIVAKCATMGRARPAPWGKLYDFMSAYESAAQLTAIAAGARDTNTAAARARPSLEGRAAAMAMQIAKLAVKLGRMVVWHADVVTGKWVSDERGSTFREQVGFGVRITEGSEWLAGRCEVTTMPTEWERGVPMIDEAPGLDAI